MSARTKLLASAVAPAPMRASLGELSEPLIPKDKVEEEAEGEEDETGALSSIGVVIGSVVLGAAGIAASAAAMVAAGGMVAVYVAGGLCVANSAVVVKNQYDISKGKGYRAGINNLRKEASKLGEQAELLVQAVNDLRSEADLMSGFEVQLSEIARKQGVNANEIVALMKENEQILAKQKANLKQTFVSDMARAFISSEFLSGDMKVDLKNLPVLMLRLQIQLNTHGMKLDTAKFEQMVQKDNDIGNILKFCGDMLTMKDDSDDSAALNMVTLDERYSKGSVEVARGKSPHLGTKKLEHRNTTVRDVKRGLSVKGIMVDVDSISSAGSEYDEEQERIYGRKGAQAEHEPEVKSKVAGKLKAAAKVSRLMGGHMRDEEVNCDQEVRRAPQPKSQSKGKFKSAALMAAAASPREGKGAGEDAETSSASRARRRQASSGLRGSFSGADDDRRQSSGGVTLRRQASSGLRGSVTGADDDRSYSSGGLSSMMRARSVDKAIHALRKKGKPKDDDDSTVASVKSTSSQSRRRPRSIESRRKPASIRRNQSMVETSSQSRSSSVGQRSAPRRQDSAPEAGGTGRRRVRKGSF